MLARVQGRNRPRPACLAQAWAAGLLSARLRATGVQAMVEERLDEGPPDWRRRVALGPSRRVVRSQYAAPSFVRIDVAEGACYHGHRVGKNMFHIPCAFPARSSALEQHVPARSQGATVRILLKIWPSPDQLAQVDPIDQDVRVAK